MFPLFIFATEYEAQSLLNLLEFTKTDTCLWKSSSCSLLICGVGGLEASYQLQKAIQSKLSFSHLINMGVAANLKHFQTHECVQIKNVHKWLEREETEEHSSLFFQKIYPNISLPLLDISLASATLTSVDCPVHQNKQRLKIAQKADLLDMEGYALSYIAQKLGYPLHMIKCISDDAKDRGHQTLLKNLALCSQTLASMALKILNPF